MVSITSEDDKIRLSILGWHKLWSFKNELFFEKKNVSSIYQNEEEIKRVRGLRIPGTHIPFLITAGTFYPFSGGKEFWDVCNKKNAIIINLENEKYKRIVVEVENPSEMIRFLKM